MIPVAQISPSLLALWGEHYSDVPLYCANEDHPGKDEVEELRDFTLYPTTVDQLQIEAYLRQTCQKTDTILHVGIGNSELAERFSGSVSKIIGLTIQQGELDRALQQQIPGYLPLLLNKYSLAFSAAFTAEFDVIVDNNPSCFCCCFFHLCRMMSTYRALLRNSGKILTARIGLAWVVTDGLPRWRFDFADWSRLAERLGMHAEMVDPDVYAMRLQ